MESPGIAKQLDLNEWSNIVLALKAISESGIYKHVSAMSADMHIPSSSVRSWIKGGVKCSNNHTLVELRAFIERCVSRPEVAIRISDAGSTGLVRLTDPKALIGLPGPERKADIIARELEIALPLMMWFIKKGTKEQRDHLRHILGTELSYEIFNAARALLTEKHHDLALKEGAI
jgi:hypothetical protein